MRRHVQPPTEKRLDLTQRPVILRFFRRSFRRVKCSMRHTKVAWKLSVAAAPASAALAALPAAGPPSRRGAWRPKKLSSLMGQPR